MQKLIGTLFVAAVASGAALLAAGPAHAVSPQIALPPAVCEVFVDSVTADDLLDDGGTDAVFLKLGAFQQVNTVDFVAGQTQPASAFGDPSILFLAPNRVPLSVHVKLGSTSKQVGLTAQIPCLAANGATRSFSDGDATYRVTYTVVKDTD